VVVVILLIEFAPSVGLSGEFMPSENDRSRGEPNNGASSFVIVMLDDEPSVWRE